MPPMIQFRAGEVAERLKALVSKTSMGAISSWVRIPPSPLRGCRPRRDAVGAGPYNAGEMPEWPIGRDWKSRVVARRPWVRIPLSPPVPPP